MSEKCWKCGMPYTTGGCGCNPTVFGPLPQQFGPPIDNEKELLHLQNARLEAENAALREEVGRWKKQFSMDNAALKAADDEIDALRARVDLLTEQNKALEESAKSCPSCGFLLPNHADYCGRHEVVINELRAELADLKDGLTAAHMDGFASGKAEATEMLREEVARLKAAERIRVAGLRETRDALVEKLRASLYKAEVSRDGWMKNFDREKARAEQAERELAELQGKRNTAYSYIEDVLIGSPYEWTGKRLLEMIGDKK